MVDDGNSRAVHTAARGSVSPPPAEWQGRQSSSKACVTATWTRLVKPARYRS